MLARLLRTIAIGLAAVAVLAQAGFAFGEPKNEWPFNRPLDGRTTQAAVHHTSQFDPLIQGEPKNVQPFIRPATVVAGSRDGFDWSSGGVGVAAGLGLAITGTGVVRLARKSPRTI
jgi:hypothetical protein